MNRPAHPTPCRQRSRHAFTLIELLVVISIIALLIALLLPSLRAARGAAQQTVCASQSRQVGVAIMMYANDNNDLIVTGAVEGFPGEPANKHGKTWRYAIFPYLDLDPVGMLANTGTFQYSDVKVWKCPTDEYIYTSTYSINDGVSVEDGAAGARLGHISYPSSLILTKELARPFSQSNLYRLLQIMIYDASSGNSAHDYNVRYGPHGPNSPYAWVIEAAKLHNEGGNFLFTDGHVANYPHIGLIDYKHWRAQP